MIKLVNGDEVFTEGRNIEEVIDRLNSGSENGNEWFYVYRPGAVVVDGYFGANEEEAVADVDGENADVIYEVEEED